MLANTLSSPPLESPTKKKFGNASPPVAGLTLETVGRDTPSGKSVRNPESVNALPLGATAVRFPNTATAPEGTPPSPVTWTFSVALAAMGDPERVSRIRAGGNAAPLPLASSTRTALIRFQLVPFAASLVPVVAHRIPVS